MQDPSINRERRSLNQMRGSERASEVPASGLIIGQPNTALLEAEPPAQVPADQHFEFPLSSFFCNPLNNPLPIDLSMELGSLLDESSTFLPSSY